MVEDRRSGNKYRCEVIVRTIDIGRSDDLDIHGPGGGSFSHYCGYVLIKICSKYGLDDKHVGIVLDSLNNAQIIHITIPVEVEVGNDV